jgi:hypothetical protein
VTTLPGTGVPLFVRLYTRFGTVLQFTDYTFTAGTFSKAALTSPTPGSTLPGTSATFSWSAGVGATEYLLRIGTTLGGSDVYGNTQGLSLSHTVTTLPRGGVPLFVRLYTRFGTVLQFTDYSFTAAP